ncbi:MAG: hypothetical protein ACJ70M_01380 [Nitrososphaera sp.]
MGRTVPSFKNVFEMEKAEWKPFRNALDKSERKSFDDMFDIPRLYVSACSNSVQLVPLHPIIISILFHHYKELMQIISEIEQMEAGTTTVINNSSSKKKKRRQQYDYGLNVGYCNINVES